MEATNSNLILETKLLHLSTKSSAGRIMNPDTNYRSCIEYDCQGFIAMDDSIEYITFSVPNAVIPNSYYTINDNNNKLHITDFVDTTIYTFPKGNYNSTYFITIFKTVLPATYNITLNAVTSTFTITNTSTAFALLANTTMDYIMGFSGYLASSAYPFTLTLPRVCNFLATPRINIRCAYFACGTMINSGSDTNDIIVSVPNNASPNGQIVYENSGAIQTIFRGDGVNSFVVCITDDENNYINFNGVSSFFTFQFNIYRKYLVKPDKFRNIVSKVNAIL